MKNCVVGFGSALMDILVSESDEFLHQSGIRKGGMSLTDEPELQRVLAKTTRAPIIVPGGSACNTTIGIARLGGRARFVGKRGSGEMGDLFETGLISDGVDPRLRRSPSKTGRVVSVITPDAQRSMLTFLGAAAEIEPDEIDAACFQDAAIAHIEGYLCHQPDLIRHIHQLALQSGARISLDLASYTVIEAHRPLINELLEKGVDILIANEDEAESFTGAKDEIEAVRIMSRLAPIAVYKMGKRGSLIASGNDIVKIDARGNGDALDTTGAGDLWASGFLYGLANGYSAQQAGKLASWCGYEVCQVVGAKIPEHGWVRIRKSMKDIE
ncbi:MAG: adenosine kinase [Desulfatirhabdiaceae bacterium]